MFRLFILSVLIPLSACTPTTAPSSPTSIDVQGSNGEVATVNSVTLPDKTFCVVATSSRGGVALQCEFDNKMMDE